MTIQSYLTNINQRYLMGNATEHTFRGDLQQLIESLVPEIRATNEPKRQSCGAPDYILTKKDIPVGFIEAKDVGDKDLDGKKRSGNKEQFDRYKASLGNLIFTDYVDFHLYNDGVFVTKVAIGEITDKGIVPLPQNFAQFENLIKDFCVHIGQNIKSPKKLAEMMAGKARLLSDVIAKALTSDETHNENSTLKEQMTAFKSILIHDITPKGFADVYAQTIAYGMFAARLHDPTLKTFSRQEAAELIPKSNPFLRKLFGYIAGPDIDDRIKWIVDNLAEIFLACNVEEILKNYGKTTKMEDPIIHFYETFLAEYDPALRKARGVWYTPAPVVNFIVRAVDDILKTEFDLPQGLADTSKTKIKVDVNGKKVEKEVHKVQILDPATGTGTFLAEVIKHVNKKFKGQEGIWSSYVENNLLPRLNGFELLMASYAMAHLKLDLLLKETGFKATKEQRTRVYLTNSLEEHHPDTGTLFASWLSTEANEANHIKRDTPVMCVIGNPPYSSSSTNNGKWIENLLNDYKKNLKETSYNSLSDDYVKFIKYGQHFIDKNEYGILAYISNNSFIDGVTHRQMRKNLLQSFDKIYILDLHGNSKKKETSPDGSIDQNVFDIMQGVSINIFIKNINNKTKKLGQVFHSNLYGNREHKYNFLNKNNLNEINWDCLKYNDPYYYFVPRDYKTLDLYRKGFGIEQLFNTNATGIKTERDSFTIKIKEGELDEVLYDLENNNLENIRFKHNLQSDGRDWTLKNAKDDVLQNKKGIKSIIQYRPFDYRHTYYTSKSKGFMAYPRNKIMDHLIHKNIAFVTTRLNRGLSSGYSFISKNILDLHLLDSAADSLQTFPLYLYPENNGQLTFESSERTPNLNQEIVKEIEEKLGLQFTNEKEKEEDCFVPRNDGSQAMPRNNTDNHQPSTDNQTFAPIDLLDYIYAVLHSPTYREKYKEFLKIDFPRVPYPKDAETFWKLVQLGGEIRQLHLLEAAQTENYITSYPKDGSNMITTKVGKKDWELYDEDQQLGRIWINESQYFDKIPLTAWEFYIGGYQPAQKWLKDRQGRTLEFEDILHYHKIIVALFETDRSMKEIDLIEIE